jgi:hypothetical protein
MISPTMSLVAVRRSIAITIPSSTFSFPKNVITSIVPIDTAVIFERFFPINISIKNLFGSRFKRSSETAPFFPSPRNVRAFARLIEKNAASETEKNAKHAKQAINIMKGTSSESVM